MNDLVAPIVPNMHVGSEIMPTGLVKENHFVSQCLILKQLRMYKQGNSELTKSYKTLCTDAMINLVLREILEIVFLATFYPLPLITEGELCNDSILAVGGSSGHD